MSKNRVIVASVVLEGRATSDVARDYEVRIVGSKPRLPVTLTVVGRGVITLRSNSLLHHISVEYTLNRTRSKLPIHDVHSSATSSLVF